MVFDEKVREFRKEFHEELAKVIIPRDSLPNRVDFVEKIEYKRTLNRIEEMQQQLERALDSTYIIQTSQLDANHLMKGKADRPEVEQ